MFVEAPLTSFKIETAEKKFEIRDESIVKTLLAKSAYQNTESIMKKDEFLNQYPCTSVKFWNKILMEEIWAVAMEKLEFENRLKKN